MALYVESPAFSSGSHIPKKYSKEGDNISPPLEWSETPSGTKEFVLIMEDPDAPGPKPFVHWLVYGIPGNVHRLVEGISSKQILQGKNSFGEIGYGGPLPPEGDPSHHYGFYVYALSQSLNLPVGLGRDELLKQIKSHVLAEGSLVGTYSRQIPKG